MRIPRSVFAAVMAAALAAIPMAAQQSTAGVNGTVTDDAGLVIQGADVVLTNVATNVQAHATTNGSGYFAFVDLTPGEYGMTITREGFKKLALPPFRLLVNQTLTENETLNVGAQNQTVTVNASASSAAEQTV